MVEAKGAAGAAAIRQQADGDQGVKVGLLVGRLAQILAKFREKKQGATGITSVAPYIAGQWGRGDNRLPILRRGAAVVPFGSRFFLHTLKLLRVPRNLVVPAALFAQIARSGRVEAAAADQTCHGLQSGF